MKAISEALAKAQAEMRQPHKDREVTVRTATGSYRFPYATLDAVLSASRPALVKHGLSVVQGIRDGCMVTTILHASGESIESALPMPPLPAKPQEAGSLITYFRRYGYCTALGIVADEDDDGNAAEGNAIAAARPRQPAPAPQRPQITGASALAPAAIPPQPAPAEPVTAEGEEAPAFDLGEPEWMRLAADIEAKLKAAQTVEALASNWRALGADLRRLKELDARAYEALCRLKDGLKQELAGEHA